MTECKLAAIPLSFYSINTTLLLVTFELLEVEQSYIPLLKALMCGIIAAGAQRCGCMFTFCHAYLKMGVLLHKMEIVHNQNFMTVCQMKFNEVVKPNKQTQNGIETSIETVQYTVMALRLHTIAIL